MVNQKILKHLMTPSRKAYFFAINDTSMDMNVTIRLGLDSTEADAWKVFRKIAKDANLKFHLVSVDLLGGN